MHPIESYDPSPLQTGLPIPSPGHQPSAMRPSHVRAVLVDMHTVNGSHPLSQMAALSDKGGVRASDQDAEQAMET